MKCWFCQFNEVKKEGISWRNTPSIEQAGWREKLALRTKVGDCEMILNNPSH